MLLQDKVAIVTGGGGGFGQEICRRFAAEGAKLVITDIPNEDAERLADKINKGGGEAIYVPADNRHGDAVEAVVAAAVERFGGLDILANNAGIVHPKQYTADMDEEMFQKVFDVNVKSIFLFNKFATPAMRERGGGAVVNTASTSGLKPRAQNAVYAVSKAAVISFTKALAMELAVDNIRVNCILPVASPTKILWDFIGEGNNAQMEQMASLVPMGRLGSPKDMASAITFLASDEAAFITGVSLPVDGGWTAG